MFRKITEEDEEDINVIEEHENTLKSTVETLEDDLMGVEMKLQDVLAQATSDFVGRVSKIIEEMKTKTGNFIKEVGDEAENFNSTLKEYAFKEQERLNADVEAHGEEAEMFQEIKDNEILFELLDEKETLN